MRLEVIEAFQITGRGLVAVLDGATGLPIGAAHSTRVSTPTGAIHQAKAYKEWLSTRKPVPVEREAFFLQVLDKNKVPIGSLVEFMK